MDNLIFLIVIALYGFLFAIAVMLFAFLRDFPRYMKNLPDAIAEKMIEKLREEEKRKQTERKTE